MQQDFDSIVIGAGHNSLTTAAYLAKAGEKILVLEKNPWIGGGGMSRGNLPRRVFCMTSIPRLMSSFRVIR